MKTINRAVWLYFLCDDFSEIMAFRFDDTTLKKVRKQLNSFASLPLLKHTVNMVARATISSASVFFISIFMKQLLD